MCCCRYLLLCLLMFALCIEVPLCWVHAAAKMLKSWSTLCHPTDGRPPGSPIPGILPARTLEWVAISFSNAWKWKVEVKSLSCVWLLATHELQPSRLLHPWDFLGKSTGVGCHCLLHVGYIDICNYYVFFLDWSLDHYVVSFFVSYDILYFWNEDCHSGFLLVFIHVEYLFPSFYFQSVCV